MSEQNSSSIVPPSRPLPRRVLVLGCTGMVGRSWIELLESQAIKCTGVSRPEFDLMNPGSIKACITSEYDLVVNAAAWTDVDGAERDEEGANRANGHAVLEIANRCKEIDATLITYSTDYVFSGNADAPYSTDSPIDPVNAYGRSKALGESLLSQSSQSGASHLLIRTSWVYAPWGTNFVRTIRNLAQSRDELLVVNDQRGRPTSAQHLAQASLSLFQSGALGTWHLTDDGECTWFDLATEIVRYTKLECQTKPCGSDQYPRPAIRPGYSTLDIGESINRIGPLGPWKSHLHEVLDSISQCSENE